MRLVAVQKFGTFLSGMIMPNIAAFIAWGFITAFFIETGWTPVEGIGGFGKDAAGTPNIGLVGPMIRFMLPLLIAIQGGRMVYGVRGGVVGVVATMGVIVAPPADVPGRDDHGAAGRLVRSMSTSSGKARSSPASRCWSTTSRPAAALAVVGFFVFGPPSRPSPRRRERRRLADRQQPAAAGQPDHRAGQGAVPEQRHQPWGADPAGHPAGRRERQVDPVPAGGQPGAGAGLLVAYSVFGTGWPATPPRRR